MADDNLYAALEGVSEGLKDVLVPYFQGNIEEKRQKRLLQEKSRLSMDEALLPYRMGKPTEEETTNVLGEKGEILSSFKGKGMFAPTPKTESNLIKGKYIDRKTREDLGIGAEDEIDARVLSLYTAEKKIKSSEGIATQKIETGKTKLTKLPSAQITDIAKLREGLDLNKSIRTQYFDLISKGKSPVDPIGGRWASIQQKWGVLSDQEQSRFMADLATQFNEYLHAMSGAAITPQEAERLNLRIETAKNSPQQFLGALDSVEAELNRKIRSRVQTLKDTKYDVGNLESFITETSTQKISPTQTQIQPTVRKQTAISGQTKSGLKYKIVK